MAALTIPTIFSAIDKISAPVRTMANNVQSFATKAESAIDRGTASFRKLTPVLGEASKQFLNIAGTAAIASAIIGGGTFSAKSIMEYQTEIANLSAITGTSGKELKAFEVKIRDVATSTKESSIEVAKAFTLIGNNSPALLKDADALAEVTKQSIILAQASKMELATSADSLTTIMNQFNKKASESKSVIDLLAGGMVIGSTDIDKVATALTKTGGVASQVAGASLPEVVTAIEAISDKMKDADLVGTQFRNMFLIMSNIKGQDPKALKDLKAMGVNMDIVARKGEPLINKLNELKKLANRPGALEHVFGKENMQSIIPLLASTDKYTSMLNTLTTSEEAKNAAQKMADKNNNTLSRSIEQLKNKYVTLITTSDSSSAALSYATKVVKFLSDNLLTIFAIIGLVVGAFLIWKGILIISNAALVAYNVVLGISNALSMESLVLTSENAIAQKAYFLTTKVITGALWLYDAAMVAVNMVVALATGNFAALNAIMLANPIGLIIAAVVILIAIIVTVIAKWNEWGAALSLFLGPLGMVISLIQSFRRNWDMISQAFKTGGIVSGLKAIGKTILDAVLMPLQQLLGLVAKFTGWDWASSATKNIEKFRADMGVNVTTDESGNPIEEKPVLDTKKTQNEALVEKMQSTNNAHVKIDINDPTGRTTVKPVGNNNFLKILTTSTMQ